MPALQRPTPAMLVALTALFIALGGSSYAAVKLSANSVRSEHIKNGEVKRSDLARNAVATTQIADGSLLATDFKDGQLPAGPQGPQGAPGAPGTTSVVVRANAGTGRVTAACLPGERALGGGAHSVNGNVRGSGPASDPQAFLTTGGITYQGYVPTSWSAVARDVVGNDADVTAWVVCAAP